MDYPRFCFNIFDVDKSGYLEDDEFHALVALLHQKGASFGPFSNLQTSVSQALGALDEDGDGRINFKEFRHMHKKYPPVQILRNT